MSCDLADFIQLPLLVLCTVKPSIDWLRYVLVLLDEPHVYINTSDLSDCWINFWCFLILTCSFTYLGYHKP